MHKFFVNENQVKEPYIKIVDQNDLGHITNALRLSIDDKLMISDNNKFNYLTTIKTIKAQEIIVEIIEKSTIENESPLDIYLYQGLPKSKKMELIIQKNVELGVKKIIPMTMDRCVVKLKTKKKEDKKLERWNKICEAAAKQSKRGIIPPIERPIDFNQLIDTIEQLDVLIVPYEDEQSTTINQVVSQQSKTIGVVIGPEGGFSAKEIEALKAHGAKLITLGPRILRTETAGFVTSSLLQYLNGDLGENNE